MMEELTIYDMLTWLNQRNFDTRKKCYETIPAYEARLRIAYDTFHFDYETWPLLSEFAYICPSFRGDRLPVDKSQLGDHECYYLQMRDIIPENWVVPTRKLGIQISGSLPRRATYRALTGDILLSRFREPLGKCVVYEVALLPLYVSSNYVLIRPRSGWSAHFLLALLKSPFAACQLHQLAQPRSVITEMFVKDARQIRLPYLSANSIDSIGRLAEERIDLENRIKILSYPISTDNEGVDDKSGFKKLSDIDMKIDQIILGDVGSQSSFV